MSETDIRDFDEEPGESPSLFSFELCDEIISNFRFHLIDH